MRGKILNIERKDEAAMYKNEEIQNLILGLGLGVKVMFVHLFLSVFVCIILLVDHLSTCFLVILRGKILERKLFVTTKS